MPTIGARHDQRPKTKQSRAKEAQAGETEGCRLHSGRANPSTQAGPFCTRQEAVVAAYLLSASLAVLVAGLATAAYLASRGETPQTIVRLSAHCRKMRDRPVIELSLIRQSHLG